MSPELTASYIVRHIQNSITENAILISHSVFEHHAAAFAIRERFGIGARLQGTRQRVLAQRTADVGALGVPRRCGHSW